MKSPHPLATPSTLLNTSLLLRLEPNAWLSPTHLHFHLIFSQPLMRLGYGSQTYCLNSWGSQWNDKRAEQ